MIYVGGHANGSYVEIQTIPASKRAGQGGRSHRSWAFRWFGPVRRWISGWSLSRRVQVSIFWHCRESKPLPSPLQLIYLTWVHSRPIWWQKQSPISRGHITWKWSKMNLHNTGNQLIPNAKWKSQRLVQLQPYFRYKYVSYGACL